VTVHDSCHARILGTKYSRLARPVYLDGSGDQGDGPQRAAGYCCGAAAGCNRYSPFDIIFSAMRELWEAQKTGARDLALYCTGCQITLSLCSWLFPTLQPVRHMLEYLREATGEEVSHPAQGRTFSYAYEHHVQGFAQDVVAAALPGMTCAGSPDSCRERKDEWRR